MSTRTTKKTTAPVAAPKVDAKDAPKKDAALTIWETIEGQDLAAIGAAVAAADAALEGAPAEYATRCREIAAAVLYGPRGTQSDIARGIATDAKGNPTAAAKKAAERYAKVGRILIAQPDLDPMKVRSFIRDAKDEEILKAIESGRLIVAPKADAKGKGTRGAGKGQGKGTRTLRQQVEAASRENAKVVTMAKAADAIPTEDLTLFLTSLRATLATVEKMLAVAAPAAKVSGK